MRSNLHAVATTGAAVTRHQSFLSLMHGYATLPYKVVSGVLSMSVHMLEPVPE